MLLRTELKCLSKVAQGAVFCRAAAPFYSSIKALGLTAGPGSTSLQALAKGKFPIAELPQQDQEESRINTQIHSCQFLRKAFRALSALDCVTPLHFHLPTNTGTIRVEHNTQNRICSVEVPIIP